jgi:serine/threonine protein kinase
METLVGLVRSAYDTLSGSISEVALDPAEERNGIRIIPERIVEAVFRKRSTVAQYHGEGTGMELLCQGKYRGLSGGFGIVSLMRYSDPTSGLYYMFALKAVALSRYSENPLLRLDLQRELQIQGGLQDAEHNTLLYHHFYEADFLYMVMQYGGHDLSETKIEDREAFLNFLRQILLGLHYLHSNGLMHRDIKLPNLLYDEVTGVYRLCDYGCAVSCKDPDRGRLSIGIGTRRYQPPEMDVHDMQGYGLAADIHMLGVVCMLDLYTGSDTHILACLRQMSAPRPEERGSTTYWLGQLGLNKMPTHLSFAPMPLANFPFSPSQLVQSALLKTVEDPAWKHQPPDGMNRTLTVLQHYEEMLRAFSTIEPHAPIVKKEEKPATGFKFSMRNVVHFFEPSSKKRKPLVEPPVVADEPYVLFYCVFFFPHSLSRVKKSRLTIHKDIQAFVALLPHLSLQQDCTDTNAGGYCIATLAAREAFIERFPQSDASNPKTFNDQMTEALGVGSSVRRRIRGSEKVTCWVSTQSFY